MWLFMIFKKSNWVVQHDLHENWWFSNQKCWHFSIFQHLKFISNTSAPKFQILKFVTSAFWRRFPPRNWSFGSFCETKSGFKFLSGSFFENKRGFKEYFGTLGVFLKFHELKPAVFRPKFTISKVSKRPFRKAYF